MLSALLNLLGLLPKAFDTVDNITNAIANEKIAGLQATTQEAKIASDERVSALQAQRDILISDAKSSNIDIYERAFIATPVGILIWKLLVWDDVLGWGTTDIPNSSSQWTVIFIVLGFYFLHSITSMLKK